MDVDDAAKDQSPAAVTTVADVLALLLPWRVEVWSGVLHLESGGDPPWDQRTVAWWAHALGPGWRVTLRSPRILTAEPVNRSAGPEASGMPLARRT